jgi:hypothetical protein
MPAIAWPTDWPTPVGEDHTTTPDGGDDDLYGWTVVEYPAWAAATDAVNEVAPETSARPSG